MFVSLSVLSFPSASRLLVVANRLPMTIIISDDGQYSFALSSGGLVSGLRGIKGDNKGFDVVGHAS